MIHFTFIVVLVGSLSYLYMKGSKDMSLRDRSLSGVACLLVLIGAHLLGMVRFGYGRVYLMYLVLTALLVLLSIVDLKSMMLPVELLVLGAIFPCSILVYYRMDGWILQVILSLLITGIGFGLSKVLRGGLGEGDVIVFGLLTLYMGWMHLLIVLLGALILAAVTGIMMMVFSGKSRKAVLPFLPFMTLVHLGVVFL